MSLTSAPPDDVRRYVLDLCPGDEFEWCGRRVRLLRREGYSHKSVVLVVIDTTDDREHHLFYGRHESVGSAPRDCPQPN